MKLLYYIIIIIICVGTVSANEFSDWSPSFGSWIANNDTHTLRKWNVTGITTWTPPPTVDRIEYLVVGGGGWGGADCGGGGAGGFRNGTLTDMSGYNVTVGHGGAQYGISGGASVFLTISSEGGGGGGDSENAGKKGGSGGGGGYGTGFLEPGVGNTSPVVQGYSGGHGSSGAPYACGGGGGASEAGKDWDTTTVGGNGGDGKMNILSKDGELYNGNYYLAGGGGGRRSVSALGGLGGGGDQNQAALVNSGGGGGSTYSGGSGLIVIKYRTPPFSDYTSANGCWTATQGEYGLVMWNTTGTSTWTPPVGVTNLEYLVVAGGGAGGKNGGGGGAGGMRNGTISISGLQTVVVGAGGTAGDSPTNGADSSFGSITSIGGGRGHTSEELVAGNGGSGGGAWSTATAFGNGMYGQGNDGGNGTATGTPYAHGGGGGAGSKGGNGTGSFGGDGGIGLISTITGNITYYAGGGGGGIYTPGVAGFGGIDGGGRGGTNTIVGTAGRVNTGGGGGGGGADGATSYSGGAGGSGIVIIKYLITTTVIPKVKFITDKTTVVFPGRIYFNDTSLNTPTQWNWSFGDGNWYNTTSPSLGLNKSYQYTKRGTWIANLTVGNSAGTNTSPSHSKLIRVIGYQGFELPKTPTIWDYINLFFAWLDNFLYCAGRTECL